MTTIRFSKLDFNDDEETHFNPFEIRSIPLFGKPKEIGHFSIDSTREIHFNRTQMRFLIFPQKIGRNNFDLDINFTSDIIHNYVTLEKMYQTLYWLKHHRQKAAVDFVSVRGTLMKVFCTPYVQGFYNSQWEICASKLNSTIYFSAIDSDEDIENDKNASLKYRKLRSWGYKFEQYLTTDEIGGAPDITSNTHQLEEYCIILKNILNKHTLLYKAEVDAVVPHRHPGPGSGDTFCYTELKTTKLTKTISENYYFLRYKMALWWAQSYLSGIPEIICGKRTDDGIVTSLETYIVSSLPQQAMGLWSADVCLNFCDKFLNFLKKTVVEDNHNVVYKFCYKGEDLITCSKIVNPCPRYIVIPGWYIKAMDED